MPDPIDELLSQVETLAGQVEHVREEARGARTALKEKIRWGQVISVILAFAVLVNLVFATVAIKTAWRVEDVSTEQRSQTLAIGITVCALQNVNRIEVQNMLTRMEQGHLLTGGTQAERDKFFADTRAEFAVVDCKLLVPEKDRKKATVNLEYPSTIPPATTTTIAGKG